MNQSQEESKAIERIVVRFITEKCLQYKSEYISQDDLYAAYDFWELNQWTLTRDTFDEYIRTLGFREDKRNDKSFWIGLKLKCPYPEHTC